MVVISILCIPPSQEMSFSLMLLSRFLAFLLLRRCSSLYAYSSGDDLPPSVWRGLCTHPITLLTNIHTLHTSLHVRMILLFTPSIAIGTQQPHNSSNTEHNPVILNRHSISLPILRLLFNLLYCSSNDNHTSLGGRDVVASHNIISVIHWLFGHPVFILLASYFLHWFWLRFGYRFSRFH